MKLSLRTLAIFLPFLAGLTACAPNLAERLPDLNTTHWAAAQDRMFARDTAPAPDSVEAFAALHAAQAQIVPTNLTLRQNVLRAAYKTGNHRDSTLARLAVARAQRDFWAIEDETFWREGVSYYGYVRDPLLWYSRVTGDSIVPRMVLDRIWKNYHVLAAPDGDVPLPEARAGLGFTAVIDRAPGEAFHRRDLGPYTVMRWFAGDTVRTYLLIRTGVDAGLALNLHKRLEAGYFALWHEGRWLVRCAPYTGFQRDVALRETGFIDLLPPRAVRAPAWRLAPPKIRAGADSTAYWFTWDNGWWSRTVARRVTVSDTAVTVADRWGWFGRQTRTFPLGRP